MRLTASVHDVHDLYLWLTPLQMTRDSTKESVAEARENLNAAISAFKAKQEEVEPLQKGRKDQNNMHRNVQTEFRDLEVRSEQELDGKVLIRCC